VIDDLKPYPTYADSGVKWLGPIPAGWGIQRGKQMFRKVARPVRPADEVITCFRDGQVTLRRLRRLDGFTEAIQESGYQGIRRGDLVIHQMDAFAGAVGVSDSDGKASPVYAVCVPRSSGSDPQYFNRVIRQMALSGWITALAKGIRERSTDFRYEMFGQQLLPVPPSEDQAAIVRYLDHIDSRIQRLIAAKERLIELLEEEKQAIIRRAVTRGFDQDVPLKPSGVEWMGDVPQRWEIRRLKHVLRLQRGHDLPADLRRQGDVPVISSGGTIGRHDETRATGPGVVIGRYGSTDAVFYLREDFWPHNTALYVTHYFGNEPRWVFRLMQALPKADLSAKSAVPGVDRKDLHEVKVALPPIEEQVLLCERVDEELDGVATTAAVIRRQVGLLREYRTRLISDAVTGKVDVREAAGHLEAGARSVEAEIEGALA